ncbi:MAG TPA: DNA-processing protein DprA, partial [Burkholderiaceae bacterium]|nr:DNA-processing protein DprA [Burkholderiaceae bacterium]
MHTDPPPDPLVLTPEQAAWLRLTMSARVGPAAMAQLLKVFGLPTAVFAASQAALARVLGDTLARSLSGPPAEGIVRAIDITRQWLQAGQQRFLLTWADADYPQALLATPDAPPVLFGMGERALLRTPMLAIVGARSSTRQGEATATAFAQSLAQAGLTIVSGLARGIDAAAHEGALAARAAGARASTV